MRTSLPVGFLVNVTFESLREAVNHFHIFCCCPVVTPLWLRGHQIIETVFSTKIIFCFNLLYLVDLEELEWRKKRDVC